MEAPIPLVPPVTSATRPRSLDPTTSLAPSSPTLTVADSPMGASSAAWTEFVWGWSDLRVWADRGTTSGGPGRTAAGSSAARYGHAWANGQNRAASCAADLSQPGTNPRTEGA